MTSSLTAAERLKFRLFAEGITLMPEAQEYIDAANGDRPMTPADYVSTSGIILALEDDVWVNVPIATYNPNFVHAPAYVLDVDEAGLVVRGAGLESRARFWLPPAYHEAQNRWGQPYTSYAFTHADRVRISPVEGCAMTCKFCDLPYDFRYRTKTVEGLVDSVERAVADPVQPAHHVLISGGTPKEDDFDYVQDVYEAVITYSADLPVDIMMVPSGGLLDVPLLRDLGVNELSINIEIYNRDIARRMMRRKFDQGLDHYLDFVASATEILGAGRVRSMFMLGLEPMEDTLAGVRAVAERGGTPVLSPFRPDQATPLRDEPPPTAEFMEEAYLRARDICHAEAAILGPSCIPCSHNTLTLATTGSGDADRYYGRPNVV